MLEERSAAAIAAAASATDAAREPRTMLASYRLLDSLACGRLAGRMATRCEGVQGTASTAVQTCRDCQGMLGMAATPEQCGSGAGRA